MEPANEDESKEIYEWAQKSNHKYDCTSYWSGLFDEMDEGRWVYHKNRTEPPQIPWGTDEPNGLEYENCAALNADGLSDDVCDLRK